MSTSTHGRAGMVPELTLGWRLRMARETTGMGLREFAAEIGVAPDTLTSAEKDRRKVRSITINAYALATGVDRQWLETGIAPDDTDPDGGQAGATPTIRYVPSAQAISGTPLGLVAA